MTDGTLRMAQWAFPPMLNPSVGYGVWSFRYALTPTANDPRVDLARSFIALSVDLRKGLTPAGNCRGLLPSVFFFFSRLPSGWGGRRQALPPTHHLKVVGFSESRKQQNPRGILHFRRRTGA